MLQLQARELLLHLAHLCEVCLHVLVLWLIYFVGEVIEELEVTLDGETPHPQGHRSPEASYEALVLCYVIGDLLALLEAELHGVVELVLGGRDENGASPHALACERAIELHDPAIRRFTPWQEGSALVCFWLCSIGPFCHEVGEGDSLDDPGRAEPQLKRLQFDVPLSDSSHSIGAPEHPVQWVG